MCRVSCGMYAFLECISELQSMHVHVAVLCTRASLQTSLFLMLVQFPLLLYTHPPLSFVLHFSSCRAQEVIDPPYCHSCEPRGCMSCASCLLPALNQVYVFLETFDQVAYVA